MRFGGPVIEIPTTLGVLECCWERAEEALRRDTASITPGSPEEELTKGFGRHFAEQLGAASTDGAIEVAFRHDLERACSAMSFSDLTRVASGLVATLVQHERTAERVTGGDVGLMLERPRLEIHGDELQIERYQRGLLGQAKLRNSRGKWPVFTVRQREKLPKHMKYLALLLYSYNDRERRVLNPFDWQLCDGATLDDATAWLRMGTFPGTIRSNWIINGLGIATIGTDDKKVIDEVICHPSSRSITITIWWPPGADPGSTVRVSSRHEERQQILVRQC